MKTTVLLQLDSYNLPSGGVSITVLNFNLTIIEYYPITINLRKTNTPNEKNQYNSSANKDNSFFGDIHKSTSLFINIRE